MRLPFNEVKATQAAAMLLRLRGGTMSYLKLIKLLYLADREALLRWERPITTDRWVSMKHGPVVSRIYGLINEEPAPGEESVWRRHIQPVEDYCVTLVEDAGEDELSRAESKLLGQIFALHGRKRRWELVKYCHTLPEWHDPGSSSTPIEVSDILLAEGRAPSEVAEVLSDIQNVALVQQL